MTAACNCNPFIASTFILQPIKKSSNFAFQIPTPRTPLTLICSAEPEHKPKPKPVKKRPMKGPTRRRSSYGTSRRSVLRKTLIQEQVEFTGPVSDDPVVAVIGGGMSGMLCALNLEKRGIRSTVFDTGLHGLGGRMGTRIIDPQPLIFDHAAQFFTVSDPLFAELVDGWCKKCLVQEWQGTIGELEAGGHFSPLPSSPPRYIGIHGMRPLADSLLSQIFRLVTSVAINDLWLIVVDLRSVVYYRHSGRVGCRPRLVVGTVVEVLDIVGVGDGGGTGDDGGTPATMTRLVNVVRPCWISALEPFNGMWHLSENGKPCGHFDAVVIAHNGKCANRLLASSGLPLIARQMKDPLPMPANAAAFPFEGAFVKGIDSLSWMANNTKKLLNSQSSGPHCWTFFSTSTFGKRNKVPQENIPNATAEKVKEAMLAGVEDALGLSKSSLNRPFYTRVQLWGAALPTNTPGIPCIFDPHGRTGICGDWLLGSSLEAAALSGIALANQAHYFESGGTRPDEFAVGLQNEFQPLKGHEIGQFPGVEFKEEWKRRETVDDAMATGDGDLAVGDIIRDGLVVNNDREIQWF
ncbi:hypothetical protein RJ640_006446 [Escallonia rubra]|uniref:FAD/NAD(P)-binding oxidoreductase family protein n=1 Tax=Escallonia rubra TaxID=112253 RepID=A0AA88R5G1_9ASTE|nr:hypothetical protein RJ640_006446 [Escallonia rubra]